MVRKENIFDVRASDENLTPLFSPCLSHSMPEIFRNVGPTSLWTFDLSAIKLCTVKALSLGWSDYNLYKFIHVSVFVLSVYKRIVLHALVVRSVNTLNILGFYLLKQYLNFHNNSMFKFQKTIGKELQKIPMATI